MTKTSFRRCICCRLVSEKSDLFRFVFSSDKTIVWDREFNMVGRGAYVHPQVACIGKMRQTAIWERALKIGHGHINPKHIEKLIREIMEQVVICQK